MRIVDQYNNPVVGAKVVIAHGDKGYFDRNKLIAVGEYFSDDDGFVKILKDGRRLHIQSLVVEGYHIDYKTQIQRLSKAMNIGYRYQGRRMGGTPDKLGTREIEKYFDREHSFPMRAWKFETYPDLYSGKAKLRFENGIPRRLSFSKTRPATCRSSDRPDNYCREKESWEANSDYDIEITIKRSSKYSHQLSAGYKGWSYTAWSLEIKAPSGGIQRSNDLYFYQAPDTGYRPRWKKFYSSLHEKANQYKQNTKFKLYVMLKDNNVIKYGRIYIDIAPIVNNKEFSTINIEYNFSRQDGSNNLASKPKRYKYWDGSESVDLNYPDTIPTDLLLRNFDIIYDSIYDLSEYEQTYYTINKLLPYAHRVAETVHKKILYQFEENVDERIAYNLAAVVEENGWRNTEIGKKMPLYDRDELIKELKTLKPKHTNEEYEFALRSALYNLGGVALQNMGWNK